MLGTLRAKAAVLTAAGLLALAGAGPATAADDGFNTQQMREMVDQLRSGAMAPAQARASCLQALETAGKSRDYREFMSTYLEVPYDDALEALCGAVVTGITSGTLSEAQLRPAVDPTGDDSEVIEFGRLLRAIFIAHHRAPAQGAAQ